MDSLLYAMIEFFNHGTQWGASCLLSPTLLLDLRLEAGYTFAPFGDWEELVLMPQSLHKTMGLSGQTATIYSSLSLKTIYIPEIHKVNCQCNNEILAQQKITIFKTGSVKTRSIQNINIYKRHKRSLYNNLRWGMLLHVNKAGIYGGQNKIGVHVYHVGIAKWYPSVRIDEENPS